MKTLTIIACLFLFLLTALAACTTPPPTATPDIPATVTVQVEDRLDSAPTATPQPTATPYPTPTTVPTATPYPTGTPRPTYTPYPTPTTVPTATPYPTAIPRPTYTPYPTPTTSPTATPYPTATPRPTYTPYPTPRLTAAVVPEVVWETVSDDTGTYTIDIPQYWILDSVEMYEDGKSSFTTWKSSDNLEASISIEAVYSEYGFNGTSATVSKVTFDAKVSSADTVAVEEPARFFDGWRYAVESLSSDGTCTFRAYEYWEVRSKWIFFVHGRTCVLSLDTYGEEVIEAVFSFKSTAYARR